LTFDWYRPYHVRMKTRGTRITGLVGRFLFAASALALAGCSGGKAAGAGGGSSQATGAKFEELMAYTWTIAPGEETYYCVFQTVTEDIWVNEYRPLSPTGTHHVTVGYWDKPGTPDGVVPNGGDIGGGAVCTGVTLGDRLAFGANVGTQGFKFPEGVAVKISAGQQILLSVHVSNPSPDPLSGRTGIEVARVDPTTVKNEKEAEIIFINNVFLNVGPGKSTQKGTCTLDAESNFFSIIHHMHKTGVKMTTRALPANGAPSVILSAPYVFTEQRNNPINVKLAKGDKVEVACDYENPGTKTLTFGESTYDNEMCIAIMYRYPASGVNGFSCPAQPDPAPTDGGTGD
jgi:Copper type II ascorbate-dependent monooxygenase, C-terminal domain